LGVPRATVVIPVLNGAAHLPALVEALATQDLEIEVLAIDSGSSDASVAILERAGARLLRIATAAFDHGGTRNLGAREARGEHVVFLSQDALPSSREFVARLIAPLQADRRLAGAFARQAPRPDADPLTRRELEGWVAAGVEPRTVFARDPASFAALAPDERFRLSVFDNVASAVRREQLLEYPFAPSRFGEDLEWGERMLRLGFGLAYVPEAVVVHSHARAARSMFRRNYLGHRLLRRVFGLRAVPDLPHLMRASLTAVASDLKTLAREGGSPALWLAAPLQALAAIYGQYRGGRDEASGRPYPRWA
jgi:rhamnosyltransferase